MIGAIIVGIIAGWAAGKVVRGRGYGLIGDLILGLIGGVIGGWIFGELNIPGPNGVIGEIVVATIGAVVLVWITHLVRREV
ncbi:MAG TPA: GlsB/YeaQ/YmgE family stress response membrane protein [Candidatus Binataceae bacterium]|nr:GlsB/YeaQ/YmgE family stress response membrane protein [Candidatus Binataceae bacterium]